jgi:hypothetical protein
MGPACGARGVGTWPAPAVDEQVLGELRGVQFMRLAAVWDVVARLLVSDPRGRARVGALGTNRGCMARLWCPRNHNLFYFISTHPIKKTSDTARIRTNNHTFVSIQLNYLPLLSSAPPKSSIKPKHFLNSRRGREIIGVDNKIGRNTFFRN